MEKVRKLVSELRKIVRFKETTSPGDLVIIVSRAPQAVLYALVCSIERDQSRKDKWWHVDMQLLTLPPQPVVWTLKEEQFSGREIFTMQGVPYFMQAIELEKPTGMPTKPPVLPTEKNGVPKPNPFSRVK